MHKTYKLFLLRIQNLSVEVLKFLLVIVIIVICPVVNGQSTNKSIEELTKKLEEKKKEYQRTLTTLRCFGDLEKVSTGWPFNNGEKKSKEIFGVTFNEEKEPGRLSVEIPNSSMIMFNTNLYYECNFDSQIISCGASRERIESPSQYLNFETKVKENYSLKLNRLTGIMEFNLRSNTLRNDDEKFVRTHREDGKFLCEKTSKLF
jgi:hypothetical protein